MRGLTIAISLLLAITGPVMADDTAQPPAIIALAATQHPDGRVELHDGVGFFSVATSNTGGAGEVRVVASMATSGDVSRTTKCETDTRTGNCLTPPVAQLSFLVRPADQRSFAIFIRRLESVDSAVLPKITVSFLSPDGVLLGAVETTGPGGPQESSRRANWLIALLLASLVYGAIMIVHRVFYPSAKPAAPD